MKTVETPLREDLIQLTDAEIDAVGGGAIAISWWAAIISIFTGHKTSLPPYLL